MSAAADTNIGLPTDCPYVVNEVHISSDGCALHPVANSSESVHVFHSTAISQCGDGVPLVKAIFPNTNIADNVFIVYNLNGGRGQISTSVDPKLFKHISTAVSSPHMFWLIAKLFVDLSDQPLRYADENDMRPLYFSFKSLADALIDDAYRLKFLRPTHFIQDERKFYLGLFEMCTMLYHSLVGNTDPAQQGLIEKSMRNQTKCKLSYHVEPKLLRSQFRCRAGCDHKCPRIPNSPQTEIRGRRLQTWCYGQLKSDVQYAKRCKDGQDAGEYPSLSENDLNKMYQFECIFSRQFAKLHYELFGRNMKMHLIFCCPKVLLGPAWLDELRKLICRQYTQICEQQQN